jgi:hypothetical protein
MSTSNQSRRETVVNTASPFSKKYLIREMAALSAKASELMDQTNLMNGLVFQTYVGPKSLTNP